tara:strand:+ start:12468 stop:12842 length:375 start_codon:yes stop_codon:yes gene_type:complete
MIEIDNPSGNILHVVIPQKLNTGDFDEIKSMVDTLIKEHGKIRILLDATNFQGWQGLESAEEHLKFVYSHHEFVQCIGLLSSDDNKWQHWIATVVKPFIEPEIKMFNADEEFEAWKWIKAFEGG